MAQQQKAAFQLGTRMNRVRGNTQTTQNMRGGVIQIPIPKNGYGSKLTLTLTAAFTGTGAGTPAWGNALEKALSLVRWIRTYNNANVVQTNMSGYGLARLHGSLERRGWNPSMGPSWAQSLPVSPTAQTVWQVQIEIPFTPNQGPNFLRGLIPLQAAQSTWTLEVSLNDISQVLSGMGNVTGTIVADLELDYLEQPDLGVFAPPALNYLYVLQEDTVQSGLTTGSFEYQVAPLQGDLMRTYVQFVQGAAPASYSGFSSLYDTYRGAAGAYVSDLRLTLGNINNPLYVAAATADNRFRRDYGQNAEPGLYVWQDAATVLDRPNEYSFPDFYSGFITPAKFADVRFKASVNLNGATAAYARCVKEYFQEIAYT